RTKSLISSRTPPTEKYPESVQVSLHFKEIVNLEFDTIETVSRSEIAILRTIYHNDMTKLDVDNDDSFIEEIIILLKNKGIDLSIESFHVLQGELERVAMMTPKAQRPHEEGLLEYLEKVIGTNKYIEQINEKAQRLEDLNERRVVSIERMRLAEREKDQLEEQKRAAEVLLLKEAQHTQLNMAGLYLRLQESERTWEAGSKHAACLERVFEAHGLGYWGEEGKGGGGAACPWLMGDGRQILAAELKAASAKYNALATYKENKKPRKNKSLSNQIPGTSSRGASSSGMDGKRSSKGEKKLSLQMHMADENRRRLIKLAKRKEGGCDDMSRELNTMHSQCKKEVMEERKALSQLEEFTHLQQVGVGLSSKGRNTLKHLAEKLACQISHMLALRMSDEDIQEAGLPRTFTTKTLREWLAAASGESISTEEGNEAEAAEEGTEAAEGSRLTALRQVVEAAAEEASRGEMQSLGRLVTWLCGNCLSTGATFEEVQSKQESSEEELKALRGNVDMSCIDEYHKQDDAFFEAFFEATDVTPERDAVRQEHKALLRRRQEEFTAGLDEIRTRVKEVYQIMAPGGDADLAPVDPLFPFSQGIRFSVRLPQQQCWTGVTDLDSRKQMLCSLALVVAVHMCKPDSPLITFELDATI
ncbi:unnamed protein product, partial [Closterium sp. Naga37s-1]